MSERTLVLVKPDGVSRGLVGEVISRIERKGLTLAALELRFDRSQYVNLLTSVLGHTRRTRTLTDH